ncbi:hypothetical protein GBA52_012580 [Prunus armeniaca]|nr:hypothetical protein GBA52_012580 [Prunus armeniaca]
MSDDSKTRGLAGDQQSQNQSQQYYGTFQGVANYYPTVPPPPPEPVVGFPQPVPPPGYAVVEGRPVHERRLPCCGMGIGWLLFIIGFFLGGIPWYVGTFILLCVRVDYREKPGYVACTIAIFEKNPTTIKNYGIWLRYQSRTGYHNMYKEYRDTTLNGAVEQMYIEMASRHRVRFPCIQIIKTATIPAKLCKRESTKQFHNSKIKFPLVFRKVRPPSRKLKTTYKASRPNLFV